MATRMGPLVHRSVHYGALSLALGAGLFVIVSALSAAMDPGYNLLSTTLSDLGDPALQPAAVWFNAGAAIAGVVIALGIWLIWTAFPRRSSRTVGLLALLVASLGLLGFALLPQGSGHELASPGHTIFAIVWWGGAALGLVFVSFAMLRDTRWGGYRLFSLVCGLVSLGAAITLYLRAYGPLGAGGLEWIVVAPWLLWLGAAGFHLYRIPTYSPPGSSISA